MRHILYLIFITVLATFNGGALAQAPLPTVPQEESLGERSLVFACFYECKPYKHHYLGRIHFRPRYWQEVTTLMLANLSEREIEAEIVFLDGNQNMIGIAIDNLSPEDLDEINVCRTLEAADIPVPLAGLIEVVLEDDAQVGGVYGWIKNIVGRFRVRENEPFKGYVRGIAKTECRLVPPSVATPDAIRNKMDVQDPPIVSPILIEGTDDLPLPQ